MTEATTAPRPADIALDAALLITLGTALLFVAGWGYAERWFAHFDLGLVGLGIPPASFGIYGYWTLAAFTWWLVPAAALVAVALHWFGHRPRGGAGIYVGTDADGDGRSRLWSMALRFARQAVPVALPVLLLAAVLLLFWGAYALGRLAADQAFNRDQANGFCDRPYVRVVLTDPASLTAVLPGTAEALAQGRYRLLIQSGGLVALIRPWPPAEAPLKPRRPGLLVPVSEVRAMELVPVPAGCGPG